MNDAIKVKQAKEDYASYIQQIVKIQWMKYVNENTKVFHQSIKNIRIRNSINILHIDGQLVSDPCKIQQAFISFYSNLLCCNMSSRKRIIMQIINSCPTLTDYMQSSLNHYFSKDDIKGAIWSIPDDKAPSLDGYNIKFYKLAWPIIRDDITLAVQEFFLIRKMLKV